MQLFLSLIFKVFNPYKRTGCGTQAICEEPMAILDYELFTLFMWWEIKWQRKHHF